MCLKQLCVEVFVEKRLLTVVPSDRAPGRLSTWRSRVHRTRRPNLWRLVRVLPYQLCLSPNDHFVASLIRFFTPQLAAAQEALRPASRTSRSRRRTRTEREPRRSVHVDKLRRSRSRRRRVVKTKRRQRPPPPSLLPVPLPVPLPARFQQSSQLPPRRSR